MILNSTFSRASPSGKDTEPTTIWLNVFWTGDIDAHPSPLSRKMGFEEFLGVEAYSVSFVVFLLKIMVVQL